LGGGKANSKMNYYPLYRYPRARLVLLSIHIRFEDPFFLLLKKESAHGKVLAMRTLLFQ